MATLVTGRVKNIRLRTLLRSKDIGQTQHQMPSKLRFKVCYCSGEDPDFPASELNTHTPHTRGWQTPRFCEYPQEIGIQFASVSDVQQLQVLSHQSKIATRIEIFVGTAVEGDPRPAYSRAKFKRMGYVSLDPNERSNFQARELKTVQFNANGLFLKLVIHKCSVNRLNIYSQVSSSVFSVPIFQVCSLFTIRRILMRSLQCRWVSLPST
jgi:centrosomal protein CEP104